MSCREAEHVAEVVDFMRAWSHTEGPLLVHCFAGISRSMAAALIGLVVKAGGREQEAAAADAPERAARLAERAHHRARGRDPGL